LPLSILALDIIAAFPSAVKGHAPNFSERQMARARFALVIRKKMR